MMAHTSRYRFRTLESSSVLACWRSQHGGIRFLRSPGEATEPLHPPLLAEGTTGGGPDGRSDELASP